MLEFSRSLYLCNDKKAFIVGPKVPYPTIPYPTPTLPYPFPLTPTLPYPTLPYPTPFHLTLPYFTLPYPFPLTPTLPYPSLSCPTLPYPLLLPLPSYPYPTLPFLHITKPVTVELCCHATALIFALKHRLFVLNGTTLRQFLGKATIYVEN